jgi:thioredoxin 1
MTEITAKELKNLQDKGEKIIVQFTAKWCGPCRALSPLLTKMSDDYENITFVKLDVDNGENSELVMNLGIMSIPTVIVYNGHKMIETSKGLQNENFYKNILNIL